MKCARPGESIERGRFSGEFHPLATRSRSSSRRKESPSFGSPDERRTTRILVFDALSVPIIIHHDPSLALKCRAVPWHIWNDGYLSVSIVPLEHRLSVRRRAETILMISHVPCPRLSNFAYETRVRCKIDKLGRRRRRCRYRCRRPVDIPYGSDNFRVSSGARDADSPHESLTSVSAIVRKMSRASKANCHSSRRRISFMRKLTGQRANPKAALPAAPLVSPLALIFPSFLSVGRTHLRSDEIRSVHPPFPDCIGMQM